VAEREKKEGRDETSQSRVRSGLKTRARERDARRDLLLTALSDGLNQDGSVGDVLSVPLLEGREHLESVGGRGDGDVDGSSIGRRSLEGVLSGVESLRRKLLSGRLSELEGLSVGSDEGVGERVEGEGSSEGHGGDDLETTRKENGKEKSATSRARR